MFLTYYGLLLEHQYRYSDHSSLLEVISIEQAVPNLFVSWKDFLKHKNNWNTDCDAIQNLSWLNIWSSDNLLEVLNENLSLLVELYVPNKVISVYKGDNHWFDDHCRRAFEFKRWAHLRWTNDRYRVNLEAFLRSQVCQM